MKTQKWSLERKIIMNGYIKKSPTNSGLLPRISRDGMPVLDVMKDGTYVMVFEGTYRNVDYLNFTNGKLEEFHPFEILLSYSKDELIGLIQLKFIFQKMMVQNVVLHIFVLLKIIN